MITICIFQSYTSSDLLSVLCILSSEFLHLALHMMKLVLTSQRDLLKITNAEHKPRPVETNIIMYSD